MFDITIKNYKYFLKHGLRHVIDIILYDDHATSLWNKYYRRKILDTLRNHG